MNKPRIQTPFDSPISPLLWAGLWLIPVLLWLDCCLRPISEPDLFFYFALVEQYLRSGVWPALDPFLYTLPSEPLMSLHQWLGYWIYYGPYALLGWAGPILVKTLLVGAVFCLPLKGLRRARPIYLPALWTLSIFVAHHRFRERVSLLGDLFVVGLVVGLLTRADRRGFWLTLPVLFLLWAQLHPSYPLGWAILLSFWVTNWQFRNRMRLIATALCFGTPFLGPMGWEGVLYPLQFSMTIEPYLRQYIVEWLPLTDSRLFGFRFLYLPFFTLIPWLSWHLWCQRREGRWFHLMIFILAVGLTIKSVRFGLMAQGLFLCLITVLAQKHDLIPRWLRQRRTTILTLVFIVALGIAGLKLSSSSTLGQSLPERLRIETTYFPEDAVNFLNQMKPNKHIFNSFGFGGYLAWRWQGDPPIFFHGFSTNFKFYEANYNLPQENQMELDAVIRRYDIGIFLLSKMGNDDAFIQLLKTRSDWQNVREDMASVIFVKRDPGVFK